MKLSHIIKINFLILGLIIVFMLMNRLKTKGLDYSFLAVMGLGSNLANEVTWCGTRVTTIEIAGLQLFQEGLKWFVETKTEIKTKTEVDFVSVEKWFGRYCTLDVEPVDLEGLDLKEFSPLMTVFFVSGAQQQVLKSSQDVYLWQNQAFRSSELDEALKFLLKLPKRAAQ